jgi:GNAT superfamily N-acetyltransferase
VLIRPASVSDIDAVIAGYEWLFAAPGSMPRSWDPAQAARRVRAAIESGDAELFVAEEADAVVGICSVYDDIDSVRFGRRAWVEDLAVDPEHRSRGIGKALLDAAKEWAREHGATHLELDSGEARRDAHRFYEREGATNRSISFGWDLR